MAHIAYQGVLQRLRALPNDLKRIWAGGRKSEIVAHIAANAILLSEAALCSQCETIGDSLNRCPRCGSDALIALTRIIPQHEDSIRLVCDPVEPAVRKPVEQEFYRPTNRNWFLVSNISK